MLASYLRQGAVRYALQGRPQQTLPEHAEAMRNFLALHTRAFDLPHLLGVAQGGGRLQHPLIQSLLQHVLGEHDPHSIGPFLDVHQDEGGPQPSPSLPFSASWSEAVPPEQRAHHTLLDTLAGLHALLTGQREHVPGMPYNIPSPAEIHRRYATGALQNVGAVGPFASLHRLLVNLPAFNPQWHVVDQALTHGDDAPLHHVPVYDLAHALETDSRTPMRHQMAQAVREAIARHLRLGVLPRLHEGSA